MTNEVKNEAVVLVPETKKQIIVNELQNIEQTEGAITPSSVVEKAQDVNSPLHDLFEWDDTEAGAKYRLWQARFLIGTVKIEYQGRQVKAFESVQLPVTYEKRAYVSLQVALAEPELHRQVLAKALKEMEYWQTKYQTLSELDGLIDSSKLEKLKKEVTL